ncbi:sensor histidine kinase [Tautonia plasticadhaerens]|uniref:histidine kinase n=1 Tax=Tautonia plasticadhaerens TaxID=2527974 RepID=A0A518H4H9_9BACT|nr:GAF domain-containing sensor histidine kinase [Tautonia plasticadhaerens]QDV35744.1 Sporulation kinase E [Tautonia plasticadhaerens]
MGKARARKASASDRGGEGPPSGKPSAPGPPDDLLPHLWRFRNQFRDGRDADKVLRTALRLGMERFRAAEGCVATVKQGSGEARLLFEFPTDSGWDRAMLAGFLRGEKVCVPPELMLARIRRHGRMWGALAVRSSGTEYHWDSRQSFSSIGSLANELIDQIDRDRVREVRARVDRKVLEQSRPKHLFYEVLHGLKSLIAYDHSATLLTYDGESDALEVVAEQVAWQKAKGRNVGRRLSPAAALRGLMCEGHVCGFDRDGRRWTDWTGTDATALAEWLDFDDAVPRGVPAEGAILCAPLVARADLLGLLKVAALHPGSFGRYEVELVSQFLPQAAVALQNSRRAESLEQKVLEAERKHAMADLARGVSHDVNNALGGVLPLVQQMREELGRGELDPGVAAEDLIEIERSIQACRRIFGGMLGFARGLARSPSPVRLRQAVDNALSILRQSIDRGGIRLVVELPEDLPPVTGVQADLEQLLLNLLSNARDACRAGGSIAVRARRDGELVELTVEDTGCGMTRERLARIREPFFTTKDDGHGLGLAICRSIVAQMRGHFSIESTPGAGTGVRASFPIRSEGGP